MPKPPFVGLLILLALVLPAATHSQERFFPSRSLMPYLLAGPRDPSTSATLLGVPRNPNAHGPGVEVEISIGSTLPVLLLSRAETENPVVLGIEAAVFARFGLQVLERELITTDWLFAVPVVWHHGGGWTRLRYYHSSSHMGDEYNRRFGDPGLNVSRDAAEFLTFNRPLPDLGVWVGVRYGYNVHPDHDRRMVLRMGAQLEASPASGRFQPFLGLDGELDQEAGWTPRIEARVGSWLPAVGGRRSLRWSLLALTGPTPLGQFRYRSVTQIGFGLHGSF